MKHLEALRILPRYFEGGLDRETVRAFHEHLKNCSDCKEQIKAMRRFKTREISEENAESPGRRRSRNVRERGLGFRQLSSLNAKHLSASRTHQRRLVFQFVLAAAAFFLAVRMGLFDLFFR